MDARTFAPALCAALTRVAMSASLWPMEKVMLLLEVQGPPQEGGFTNARFRCVIFEKSTLFAKLAKLPFQSGKYATSFVVLVDDPPSDPPCPASPLPGKTPLSWLAPVSGLELALVSGTVAISATTTSESLPPPLLPDDTPPSEPALEAMAGFGLEPPPASGAPLPDKAEPDEADVEGG